MKPYPKNGNSSAITGYEDYSDRIYVRYHGGRVYGYSYGSAGAKHVEEMKRLAEAGEGLARYINTHVKNGYFFKDDESAPRPVPEVRRREDKGAAPMPPELQSFDFRPLVELQELPDRYPRVRVFYPQSVPEEEKVPGLLDFVAIEYRHIMEFMMKFFRTDNLPWEISIELSDRHMVNHSGTLSDSQIVDRIQSIYKNGYPDPREIERILAERISTYDLWGLYCGEPRHIKLFYRMFDVSKGPEFYLAQVRQTLAHELLHAKHHIDAVNTFSDERMEAVRVKEALADFFAYYYTQNPETCCWGFAVTYASVQAAADRLHDWKRKFGGSWPYAYALNIFPVDDGGRRTSLDDEYVVQRCIDKYREVWRVSCINMQEAYAELMEMR